MAVQAQYQSNLFLLNRNAQEGKNTIGNDYSLLQQTVGGAGAASTLFDHQQHIPFNAGVGNNNTRKRSRELISPMNSSGTLMALHQSQNSNQIIDFSQLQTPQIHQNNVVSTGLRLAYNDQLHHQTQQWNLSLLPSQKSSNFLPFLSQDLASHIKQQREDIENFITIQGEQLRHASAEKQRNNLKTLLIAAEESISGKLKEKQSELDKAIKLNSELESRAIQLRAEVHAWQARARENEAVAASLQAEINRRMMSGGGNDGVAEIVEDEGSEYVDPGRVTELTGPSCKGCGRRVASVVLLPCRHLCLCVECDSVARCCPLCYAFRSSSVEVVMG